VRGERVRELESERVRGVRGWVIGKSKAKNVLIFGTSVQYLELKRSNIEK